MSYDAVGLNVLCTSVSSRSRTRTFLPLSSVFCLPIKYSPSSSGSCPSMSSLEGVTGSVTSSSSVSSLLEVDVDREKAVVNRDTRRSTKSPFFGDAAAALGDPTLGETGANSFCRQA